MNIYPHLLDGLRGYLHLEDGGKWIKPSATLDLSADISIGKGTIISDEVMIYTHEHDHSYESDHTKVFARPKSIGSNVYIGARAIVLSKCDRIPNGVVIGAGSVVTKAIPEDYANTIWAGNPARMIQPRFPTHNGDFLIT